MATLVERILEMINNPPINLEWEVFNLVNQIDCGTLLTKDKAVVWVLSASDMEQAGYNKPDSSTLYDLANQCCPTDFTEVIDPEIRWNRDEWEWLIPEARREDFFENGGVTWDGIA